MKSINDRNGRPVNVGSLVRIIHIDEAVIKSLPENEKQNVESMLNQVFEVYEIDEYEQAWVEKKRHYGEEKIESHSLGLSSQEIELIKNKV